MIKVKNGENVPYLEITEVASTHCNVVNNSYLQNSTVLHTFVSNKTYGHSEFSYILVWLIDQNSNTLEIEDKINITLVIN